LLLLLFIFSCRSDVLFWSFRWFRYDRFVPVFRVSLPPLSEYSLGSLWYVFYTLIFENDFFSLSVLASRPQVSGVVASVGRLEREIGQETSREEKPKEKG